MDFIDELLIDKIKINENFIFELKDELLVKSLSNKQFLVSSGQKCDFLGFVEKGTLRSFVYNEEGEECNNDFYFSNAIVTALTSYLTGENTNCNIQALSNATVYYITKNKIEELIDKNPEWLKLTKYVSDTYFIRKCKRETSLIKDGAYKRLLTTMELYPNIQQLISQRHIASYLGIRPQSLSRIKSSHR